MLGAWPLAGLDASFVERMQAYAVKAAREGKEPADLRARPWMASAR
jgi:maltooligosyltrehalose synthase